MFEQIQKDLNLNWIWIWNPKEIPFKNGKPNCSLGPPKWPRSTVLSQVMDQLAGLGRGLWRDNTGQGAAGERPCAALGAAGAGSTAAENWWGLRQNHPWDSTYALLHRDRRGGPHQRGLQGGREGGHEVAVWTLRRWWEPWMGELTDSRKMVVAWSTREAGGDGLKRWKLGQKHRRPSGVVYARGIEKWGLSQRLADGEQRRRRFLALGKKGEGGPLLPHDGLL
jgi:hypothetical protein